ncbi:AcuB2 [Desulforapulum autotrophicum HRM2]|uniref:AcuB2 n=1 Tax=Desulforapulum autotrophicum (strain ATCC 43914 / DSM 3382 / VKM B-1955 / HRM2) TaxID=177437 RepID=C0QJF8_DESAH|nr:CBS and ACT domain-containing protein [Desulforapulum autotrophicum]ACN15971.1 AcuB2 [Desulforapulum autotrophicum HRM2]
MFVSKSMVKKVITIDKNRSVIEAQEIMQANDIRHLPVVDKDNHLQGIITDRDIRSSMPFMLFDEKERNLQLEKIKKMTVADIMTPNPKTISPMDTIQDALLLIQREKVGAFPVVDEKGALTGILSVRDLLRAFTNVMGIGEPGTLIGVIVEDRMGQLKKIVDVVTEEKISFGSVLVARYWDEGKRAVFIYLRTNNVVRVKKRLQEIGFELIAPMTWYLEQLPETIDPPL